MIKKIIEGFFLYLIFLNVYLVLVYGIISLLLHKTRRKRVMNMGWIMVIVSVIYLSIFVYRTVKNHSFRYRPKFLIAFIIIFILGVYCLITGEDITKYVG